MSTFAKELAEAASPVPSLYFNKKHYRYHACAVFRSKIGTNNTGGNDYWVTLRAFGDKIGKQATLIGVQEGDGVLKVGDFIPLEVVEHLQYDLDRSHFAYRRAVSGRDREEVWDHARECAGQLAYLTLSFKKIFFKPTRYYDGPKVPGPGGRGTMNAHREVTERYFVQISRSGLYDLHRKTVADTQSSAKK